MICSLSVNEAILISWKLTHRETDRVSGIFRSSFTVLSDFCLERTDLARKDNYVSIAIKLQVSLCPSILNHLFQGENYGVLGFLIENFKLNEAIVASRIQAVADLVVDEIRTRYRNLPNGHDQKKSRP